MTTYRHLQNTRQGCWGWMGVSVGEKSRRKLKVFWAVMWMDGSVRGAGTERYQGRGPNIN